MGRLVVIMNKNGKKLKLSQKDKKTLDSNISICTEMGGKVCEDIANKEKAP
jgi:hypothetical protein